MISDKKTILKEVIKALMDNNNVVSVETVDARYNAISGSYSSNGALKPFTPQPHRLEALGNVMHAKSIKIGKDISINKTKWETFVIRTKNGEAIFKGIKDEDFKYVWLAALKKYEHGAKSDFMYPVRTYMQDDELRKIAKGSVIDSDKVSKLEMATKQLQELGVQPNRLLAHAMRQKQND